MERQWNIMLRRGAYDVPASSNLHPNPQGNARNSILLPTQADHPQITQIASDLARQGRVPAVTLPGPLFPQLTICREYPKKPTAASRNLSSLANGTWGLQPCHIAYLKGPQILENCHSCDRAGCRLIRTTRGTPSGLLAPNQWPSVARSPAGTAQHMLCAGHHIWGQKNQAGRPKQDAAS